MSDHREPLPPADVASVEAAFLEARDAIDAAEVARATDIAADIAALQATAEGLARPVRSWSTRPVTR